VADLGLGALGAFGGRTRTIRPVPTSPLIDTEALDASHCGVPNPDQRGRPRPAGLTCDTGAVELQGRPDAQIRQNSQVTIGDDVFSPDGQGQVLSVSVRRTATATVTLRFQNDGERPDRIQVTGPGTDTRFTVAYTRGRANITTQVVGGGSLSPNLAVGASDTVILTLTPRTGAVVGTTRTLVVTGTSGSSPTAKDAVQVQVRVV
jgi:hypothetical protein